MSDLKHLSPSRRAFEVARPVFAILFLCAITLPYVSLYRLKHGAYLTEETLRLFPISFGVGIILGILFFLKLRRKEMMNKSLLMFIVLGSFMYVNPGEARPVPPTINCPPGDTSCGSLPPPPLPPRFATTQPSRPVPRREVGPTGEIVNIATPVTYRVGMTSTAGDHVSLFKDGPIAGYWVGGFTNNSRDAYDTQIWNMTDINGGALMSGDIVQFKPYRSSDQAGNLWAVPGEGMKLRYPPSADTRGGPRLPKIRIKKFDGSEGAVGPEDSVRFEIGGGAFSDPEDMFFVPHSLGTVERCGPPSFDSNNPVPMRNCQNVELRGSLLTFGDGRNVPVKDKEFHLSWAVDERAFNDAKYWIDREIFEDRERFEKYVAVFDGRDPLGRSIDQMLSEVNGFEGVRWGRVLLDAMHAFSEGAAWSAAAGTIIGMYTPLGGPLGGLAGVVFVGAINAGAAASESINDQKKEYAREQAAKNKAAWDAARKRETESPDFVGPPRPAEPPTGFGDDPST